MAKNRVKELVQFWGEEKGLGIALCHFNESNERSQAKWLGEFDAYFAAQPAPEPPVTKATFNAQDAIRARGMGVPLNMGDYLI